MNTFKNWSGIDQMTTDEFVGQVIHIGRLDLLKIEIDHGAEIDERVEVVVDLTYPFPTGNMPTQTRSDMSFRYKGVGPTMGYALRECRESIRQGQGQ